MRQSNLSVEKFDDTKGKFREWKLAAHQKLQIDNVWFEKRGFGLTSRYIGSCLSGDAWEMVVHHVSGYGEPIAFQTVVEIMDFLEEFYRESNERTPYHQEFAHLCRRTVT